MMLNELVKRRDGGTERDIIWCYKDVSTLQAPSAVSPATSGGQLLVTRIQSVIFLMICWEEKQVTEHRVHLNIELSPCSLKCSTLWNDFSHASL